MTSGKMKMRWYQHSTQGGSSMTSLKNSAPSVATMATSQAPKTAIQPGSATPSVSVFGACIPDGDDVGVPVSRGACMLPNALRDSPWPALRLPSRLLRERVPIVYPNYLFSGGTAHFELHGNLVPVEEFQRNGDSIAHRDRGARLHQHEVIAARRKNQHPPGRHFNPIHG